MDETAHEGWLRAGELAARAGVSKDTLRFYERRGLLPGPERLANDYRIYPPTTVERLLWIRSILATGFAVDELAEILAERDAGGVPCRKVRELGAAKLGEVEERLVELTSTRDALRTLLDDWDRRLAESPAGEPADLLRAIPAGPPAHRPRKGKLR